MHQFPRSAVRTGTDWIPRRRAGHARRRPDKASPTRIEQPHETPARRPPAVPADSRPLPPRTVEDRAANLRRIDGVQLGRPHDRGGAAAEPPRNRPILCAQTRPAPAWAGADDRSRQVGISIRSAWRHPTARISRSPRFWPAAAGGHFGVGPPASRVDSRRTASRDCADVPAPSRCHPAACFANSPAPPRTNARQQ
jgi:hypothetical protein